MSNTLTVHAPILPSSNAPGKLVSRGTVKEIVEKGNSDNQTTIPGAQMKLVIVESATNKMLMLSNSVKIF
jgi:hypothetical protein